MPESKSNPLNRSFTQMVKKAKNLKAMLEEERKLTRLFYKSLESQYRQIREQGLPTGQNGKKHLYEKTLKEIDDILHDQADMSWENANYVEQLLIALYDETTLDVELGRRLVEAEENLSANAVAYYRQKAATDNVAQKRALLKTITKDIQWENQKQELKRVYTMLARRNTGGVFILSVVIFAVVVLFLEYAAESLLPWADTAAIEVAGIAMASGAMGSAFSLLTGLKSKLSAATFDELKVQRRFGIVVTRVIIGLGAALILVYFLQAGILEGSIFPEIKFAPNGNMIPLDIPNLSLLIVWSVVAGFSEKFVPNLISQTEEKAKITDKTKVAPKPAVTETEAVG